MKLVVVESPSKAKTINKYLGKEYLVKSSKGHMVDLPKSKISVDVENGFEPVYETTKKKVLSELKKAYKDADELILAADLDREGEAIAYHVAHKLGAITKKGKIKKGHSVKRIVFSEISKDAIQEAMTKPRELNLDLFNAQQARRILDRLVGYKLSPVLWKKITFGLSAGRVQSVALRLIVERELERRAFDAEEYWSVNIVGNAKSAKDAVTKLFLKEDEKEKPKLSKSDILFELSKISGKKALIQDQKSAEKILKETEKEGLEIVDIKATEKRRFPKAPFTTSTLQQTSVNSLGYSAKKTMMIAQKLYEKGFITYMRTDSVNMAAQAVEQARKVIVSEYGQDYLPAKALTYSKKAKNAQEAHECVRPVDMSMRGEDVKDMTPDMKVLFALIKNRALASQMNPARVETTTIKAKIKEYEFKSSGMKVLFDGYLRAMQDVPNDSLLPEVKVGDNLAQLERIATQHFTQPPARYSEASIVKKLEELGIGRPSTYASIISTIISRKYVLKEGRYLEPTITGETVNKLLVKYFNDVVDYGFTAEMEDKLDKVANGEEDWVEMLKEFYFPFEKTVKKNEQDIPREEFTVLGDAPEDMKCPVCNKAMVIKLGRYGQFYSCSDFPKCKGMRDMDGKSEQDVADESKTDEFKQTYNPAPKTDDGVEFELKKGRYGMYWAHPEYPKVKDARPLELQRHVLLERYGDIPQTDDKRDYILKNGRFGEFWAHPDYPEVKDIVRIPKKKKGDK